MVGSLVSKTTYYPVMRLMILIVDVARCLFELRLFNSMLSTSPSVSQACHHPREERSVVLEETQQKLGRAVKLAVSDGMRITIG